MTVIDVARFTRAVAGFTVTVVPSASGTVIALRGDADSANLFLVVNTFARVIGDHDGAVIVDVSDVTFIDTATLRAIMRARAFLGGRGRPLTLHPPSSLAARVLRSCDLSQLIEPDARVAP